MPNNAKFMKCQQSYISAKDYHRHIYEYIKGTMDMPENYYIGNQCRRNHGIDGETVRNKQGKCIACQHMASTKFRLKNIKDKNRDISALHKYEEMQEKEHDEWDYEL